MRSVTSAGTPVSCSISRAVLSPPSARSTGSRASRSSATAAFSSSSPTPVDGELFEQPFARRPLLALQPLEQSCGFEVHPGILSHGCDVR